MPGVPALNDADDGDLARRLMKLEPLSRVLSAVRCFSLSPIGLKHCLRKKQRRTIVSIVQLVAVDLLLRPCCCRVFFGPTAM